MANHEIIVQVGPEIDLQQLEADKMNSILIDMESELIVDSLTRHNIIPSKKQYTVKFRNDDLGEEVKYPMIIVSGKYYTLTLYNVN